jgi:putative ABC transport system permease protein
VSLVELLRFATGALRGHRLRTILSVLGVAIGVASVMVLTSLGEGAREYITGEFKSLGSNLLIVLPGKTETEGEAPIFSQAPHDLTLADMEAVTRRSPRVRRAAPILLGTAFASHGERRREVSVIGTTSEMLPIRRMSMSIGRFLPEGELERGARVCVIGTKIKQELFPEENPLGTVLHVGGERFKVIGVMAPRGVSLGFDLDDMVEIPVSAAMALFDRTTLFRIFIEARSHDELDATARDVIGILKERHEGVEDITVIKQDSLLAAFGKILSVLTGALAAIAAISLGVAGIGIMNVMLVSVNERTGEIGLLKALGAGSRQILGAFLLEASVLSSIGGALGVVGGYALAALIRFHWPVLPAEPPNWAVASALVVAVGVGLAFGALPARRASRLDPVAALAKKGA